MNPGRPKKNEITIIPKFIRGETAYLLLDNGSVHQVSIKDIAYYFKNEEFQYLVTATGLNAMWVEEKDLFLRSSDAFMSVEKES